MANKTFKLFADKMGGVQASNYIGTEGDIFYDPTTTTLRISDGETVGGNEYSIGTGGGTSNRLVNGEHQVVLGADGLLQVGDGFGAIGSAFGPGIGMFSASANDIPGYYSVVGSFNNTGDLGFFASFVNENDDITGGVLTYNKANDQQYDWTFDQNGDTILPQNGGIVFDRANTSIRVGMGFHIASGEGIDIQAIDQTDPDNLLYKNWYFGTDGKLTLPSGGTIFESDGLTGTAIKLTPAGGANVNQALLIYPTMTEGDHIHLAAGGGTTELYLGDDFQYVKLANNGDIIVNAQSDAGPNAQWSFGTDGSLTLPSGNTTISNLFGSDAIISAPNTIFGVLSQGSTGSGVLQWLDSIVEPMTNAGIVVNSPYAASTGSVQIYTGIVGPTPQNAWTFDPDGATTFPGAIVKSTVAKAPLTAGLMTAIITSPNSDPAWVDGTYSVTWTGGGSADIIITASAFDSIANVVYGTGTWEIGDVIGSFNVGGIGNILLIVDSINAIAPLDLTKSINKLTAGEYSLADGVEGQIMYMVPRNGITSASSVTVVVANGRVGDFTGQDALLSPFRLFNGTDYIDSTGMCTLIFTDGAWQQQGGAWD